MKKDKSVGAKPKPLVEKTSKDVPPTKVAGTQKEKPEPKEIPEGLYQAFQKEDGKMIELHKFLGENDWWVSKGSKKLTMLTHGAVQKIADCAGVGTDVQYTILTQPDAYNNYQYTIQARICRGEKCVTELGEANRNSLGSRGRNNPANMAQKRAYDRAVLRLLGIRNILSEEELSEEDNDEDKKVDNLSHEERKKIAPMINDITLAKKLEDLKFFSGKMKKIPAGELNQPQTDYLRKLWQKRYAELSKVSF